MNRVYKLYLKMHNSKSRIIRKLIHFWLRSVYTCDIMPQTKIGEDCHFAHEGLGVVINQDAVIGDHVKIGAHVIIGGRNNNPLVPQIGNSVEIGAGAILLGDISIGDGCIIGAGTVLVQSVPKNAVVVGNPGRVIKYVQEEQK